MLERVTTVCWAVSAARARGMWLIALAIWSRLAGDFVRGLGAQLRVDLIVEGWECRGFEFGPLGRAVAAGLFLVGELAGRRSSSIRRCGLHGHSFGYASQFCALSGISGLASGMGNFFDR